MAVKLNKMREEIVERFISALSENQMGDDSLLMNQEGGLLMRSSDTSAIDLETGELHIISSFDDDYE